MKLLAHVLGLCVALALTRAYLITAPIPHDPPVHPGDQEEGPHRCEGVEMDAATVDEDGTPYFFKGKYLFKGFHDFPEPTNQTFPGMDDIHQADAAFCMHHEGNPQEHNHMFFFTSQGTYRYFNHQLQETYPKSLKEDFPGIPDRVDAAVECPEADCGEDSVLFFKGHEILHFKIKTKTVESKTFDSMPNCSSALRYLGHYYCFHGDMFSKFDPKTGAVHGKYPKDTRDYFAKCRNYSIGSDHTERERCSLVPLDAITYDGAGNTLAFRGHYLIHKHKNNTLNARLIESEFKEVHSHTDAVFTFRDYHHIFKGNNIYRYKVGEHQIQEGYPKSLMEEMGFNGPIDAAFLDDNEIAHIIKGPSMISVDMKTTPPTTVIEHPIFSFQKVDGAMWHEAELKVIVGNHFYTFKDPMGLVASTSPPEGHKVSTELFGCDH